MDAKKQYHRSLDLIQQLIRITARQHLLAREDTDDFGSFVHMKLMEQDARVFRVFEGKCSQRTYLTTVIRRLYNDYRNHRFGRWRISAGARRLGPAGILLETLMVRDGYGFEQAFEAMTTNHGMDITRAELAAIAAKLPVRMPPKPVPDAHLETLANPGGRADEAIVKHEWQRLGRATEAALNQAREKLDEEERLILKLCFEDGFTVMQIARALHLEKNRLYRRLKLIFEQFRKHLESQGIGAEEAEALIGKSYGSIRINFENGIKTEVFGQSNSNDRVRSGGREKA